jgi:hypothetical protein
MIQKKGDTSQILDSPPEALSGQFSALSRLGDRQRRKPGQFERELAQLVLELHV